MTPSPATASRRPGAILFLPFLGFALAAAAADWPHWRGPAFTGASPETNLPAGWSKTDKVAWVTAMPGPSAATPVVAGNRVFLPSTDASNRTLLALALDRTTGRVAWKATVAEGDHKDNLSNYASPSAVADDKRVIFYYGNGDLLAFDPDGKELWRHNLQKDYGEFAYQWTPASSPTLHDGRLYLQILQRNEPVNGRGRTDGPIESLVLALDPVTGKELWRNVRPSEAAAESHEAYSTPIPFSGAGRNEVLIVGGDCLTGHDAATGKELWRWGTWNPDRIGHWRLVPSPVAGGGVVLACGPKGSPVFAIRAGGNGTLPDTSVAWKTDQQRSVTSDVPTPAFYQGDFFVLSDVRKALTRVDPATGHVKWTLDTPGSSKYEASPTAADGRIFLINFRGEVAIVDAAEGKLLGTVPMADEGEDRIRSSVIVAQRHLFIRTNRKLYCIGAP